MSTVVEHHVNVNVRRHSVWACWPLWPFLFPLAAVLASAWVIKWAAIGAYWLFVLAYRFVAVVVVGLHEVALATRSRHQGEPTESRTSDAD